MLRCHRSARATCRRSMEAWISRNAPAVRPRVWSTDRPTPSPGPLGRDSVIRSETGSLNRLRLQLWHGFMLPRRPEACQNELDEPTGNPVGATLSPHYGGRPQWPKATVFLRNVGRSPAIHALLHLLLVTEPQTDMEYSALSRRRQNAEDPGAAPWIVGRDYPHNSQTLESTGGIVRIGVVPVGESVAGEIENRLAANADGAYRVEQIVGNFAPGDVGRAEWRYAAVCVPLAQRAAA